MPNDIPMPAGYGASAAPSDIPLPGGYGGKGEVTVPSPEKEEGTNWLSYFDNPQGRKLGLGPESLKNLLSLGDLAGSIPAGVAGTAADALSRSGDFLFTDASHKEISEKGAKTLHAVQDKLGSPLHKALRWAGMGENELGGSNLDRVSAGLEDLLREGGAKVEEKSGGLLNADDIDSLANGAMNLAGGKGLHAGVVRLLELSPKVRLDVAQWTPEGEMAKQRDAARSSEDPLAAGKLAQGNAALAEAAAKAKKRVVEGKALNLDPVSGKLEEAIPEPGKSLPKPTSLDTALSKSAAGRHFDMTAEERIALKGLADRPLDKPIVDEQGKVLNSAEYNVLRRGRAGPGQEQRGSIDPKMLSRLAAVGLGAWAGMYFSDQNHLDEMLKHGLVGGIGAALLSKSHPIEFAKAVKGALGKEGPRFSIAEPAREWDTYRRLWTIDTHLLQNKMDAVLPKLPDREAVLHAREAGPAAVARLSPKQREYAKLLDEAFDARLWEGIDNDVLKSAADNYVTHLWDWSGNNKGMLESFLSSHGVGMSQSTPFSKERSIPTVAAGKAMGLKPLSEDPTFIVGAYSNSLINAIANKNLIGALKKRDFVTGGGKTLQLVMPGEKAPREYVSVNHPSLSGFKVHPDIEGQMKLLFDTSPAGEWMKGATLVSDTAKHMGVSMSLFHAKSLIEAAVRASNRPVALGRRLPGMLAGTDDFLKEVQKGLSSQLVKDAVGDGVMFSVKGVGSEDAGSGFYSAMKGAQKFADSILPGAGLPIKGFEALNKKLDTLLWERLHPALKLWMYSEKRAQLLENSMKEARRSGRPSMTKEEAGRIAASFTNDLEGSQNYPRLAMEAQTRFGRMVAEKAFTPAGRRGMQVTFFSPDWNISAIRAVANAFRPEGSVRGVLSPKTLADLHRNLVLRSALYYFVAFDTLNYSMSGHHIWQNKDWTKVDMDEKGERHLQIDKGMMEVPNMLRQPQQEFLNKLGILPSEVANQVMGTEYLAPRVDKRTQTPVAGPPMREGRMEHAAGRFLPFAGRQSPTKGPVEEALTRAGVVQITGSTPERREKAKKEEAERRKKQKAGQ